MYDLPAQFCDLSPKRQKALADLRQDERQDAALNVVAIGIKGLNQVYGMGIKSLSQLSKAWGSDITDFYNAGNDLHTRWAECSDSGDLITDPLSAFRDLSPRRMREITAFLVRNRQEAQGNAYAIGLDTMRRELGFGDTRIARLEEQWQRDLRDFYRDRETCEPMLRKWINDIGFLWENGRFIAYFRQDGVPVRKAYAERMIADAEKDKAKAMVECGAAGTEPV